VNPWQYVNVHSVDQYSLLDLSIGGIHHSWEEDENLPNGNIVYEVQQDVMDDFCTLRSFDQGKIKDDGTIRTIHIDDYFQFLDVTEEHNTIDFALRRRQGTNLLKTPYYSMDELQISDKTQVQVGESFDHLFVLSGVARVTYADTTLTIGKGHSCFVPWKVGSYTLEPVQGNTTVLKTYIDGI
jgi:mannose-6-phosphate isomerase class I